MEIEYSLPDFTAGLGLNLFFARIAAAHPEMIQRDVRIGSIYGCFPGCSLNGGRALVRERANKQTIERTFSILDEYGLRARLTLTNMMATPADMDDPYARTILEAGAAHGAEAIVYSDAVRDEIRRRYGMHCTLSTTRPILDVDELNRALAAYDCVVLNYQLGKDEGFLARVDAPEKLEIMVNEFCVPTCPYRQDHYMHNSEDQRAGKLRPFPCKSNRPEFFDHEPGHSVIFTDDEVRSCAMRNGVHLFKIVGRGTPFETNLEALSYYLIRPEARDEVKAAVYAEMRR